MRIALATVGTTGDVRPFALLARHLAARGHQVTAVTWPVHRAALAADGVRVEVAGPHADASRIAAVAADAAARSPIDQVSVLRDFHLADGEAHLRRLHEILPGHDLVLLHGIHALAHAAVLDLDLRWATAVFDPVLLPTKAAPPPGMPSLGPANALLWGILDRMLARANGPLDEILSRAGSRQRGIPLFRARSPLLHLVACSPAIARVPADLPATTHVTGAWLDRSEPEPLPAAVEAFLADGAEPATVTFGSMGSPGAAPGAAIERVLDAGRRVVLQGDAEVPASPSLLRVGELDHRALFARSAAVVHHGGAGTTHTAALAGVPQVVVPHIGDQRYWADRLHRLGVSPPPIEARKLRADALTDAILRASTDPDQRARAGELAERMRDEDGIGAATRLVEALGH